MKLPKFIHEAVNTEEDSLKKQIILWAFLIISFAIADHFYYYVFKDGFLKYFVKIGKIIGLNNTFFTDVPFYSWSITLASLKNPIIVVSLFILFAPVIWLRRKITWDSIEYKKIVKPVIMFIVFVLAWSYSCYSYNVYFDQGHYLDRILIIALAVLAWRNPLWIAPFLGITILVQAQLNYPLHMFSLTDTKVVFEFLIMFVTFLLLTRVVPLKSHHFVFMAICLIGSNYYSAAIAKLSISPTFGEWPFVNELHMHTKWSHFKGWMSFLPQSTLTGIYDTFEFMNIFMLIMTIIIELIMPLVAIMLGRRIAMLCFAAYAFLHLNIFVESGIIFWRWILLDIAMVFLIWKATPEFWKQIGNRRNALAAIVIIVFSAFYFRPVILGWWDTRMTNTYAIEVVGESGHVYDLNANMLSPYVKMFTFGRFAIADDRKKIIYNSHITQEYDIAMKLRELKPDEIEAYRQKVGKNYYDPVEAEHLRKFLKQSFRVLDERQGKRILFNYLSPIHSKYTRARPSDNVFDYQEPIKEVNVRFDEYFFDGEKIVEIDSRIIMTVPIKE